MQTLCIGMVFTYSKSDLQIRRESGGGKPLGQSGVRSHQGCPGFDKAEKRSRGWACSHFPEASALSWQDFLSEDSAKDQNEALTPKRFQSYSLDGKR